MIVVANNMRLHILLWYVPMMGVGFKGSWEFIMLTHIIHSTLSVLWVPRYNMFELEQFPVLSRQWRPAHVFSPGSLGKPSKENMMGAPTPWICIPVCSYEEEFSPRLNIRIIHNYPCHDYSIHWVYKSECTSKHSIPDDPRRCHALIAWTRTLTSWPKTRETHSKATAKFLKCSPLRPHFLRVWSGMVGKMPPNCWVNVGNYMVSGQIKWAITLFTCGKETRFNESPMLFTHFQVHQNADLVLTSFSNAVTAVTLPPFRMLQESPTRSWRPTPANRWIHLNTTSNCPK